MAEKPDPSSLSVGGPTPGRTGGEPDTAIRGGVAAPTGDLHEGLALALAHVDAALAHARAGEWEAAGERDRQCRAQVETLVGNAGDLDPEPLADGLSTIRERYRELLSLAESERDRLANDVRQSVKGRAGTRAYEENR